MDGLSGAAPARPVTLLMEGAGMGDDDDDVEVVREAAPVAVGLVIGGEQGVLVKNIIQAEKALKVCSLSILASLCSRESCWTMATLMRRYK
jgi:hypothetical protein